MLNLLFPLPRELTVAFSGGVDSVAVIDFLKRKHSVTAAFFHHGTENSDRAFKFVSEFCYHHRLPMMVGMITQKTPPRGVSMEEHWRNERYKFLDNLNETVVTAHHLDDCVETYLWSTMHGKAKVIPHRRNSVVRPFLTTPKSEFIGWCQRHKLEWCEDSSNDDTVYMRNYVRHNLMPHALHVNPGLSTVVKKIVEKQSKLDTSLEIC